MQTRREFLQYGLALALCSFDLPKTFARNHKIEFMSDSEEVLLARMLLGEARDCSDLEKIAIAYTALNRSKDGKKWNGENIREAILNKRKIRKLYVRGKKRVVKEIVVHSYSCFNPYDPNRKIVENPEKYDKKSFEKCLKIAREVLDGKQIDPTNGATHYYNPSLVAKPKWANKIIKIGKIEIGKDSNNNPIYSKHEFYKEL